MNNLVTVIVRPFRAVLGGIRRCPTGSCSVPQKYLINIINHNGKKNVYLKSRLPGRNLNGQTRPFVQ